MFCIILWSIKYCSCPPLPPCRHLTCLIDGAMQSLRYNSSNHGPSLPAALPISPLTINQLLQFYWLITQCRDFTPPTISLFKLHIGVAGEPPGSPTHDKGGFSLADLTQGPQFKFSPVFWAAGPHSVWNCGEVVWAMSTKLLKEHHTYITIQNTQKYI